MEKIVIKGIEYLVFQGVYMLLPFPFGHVVELGVKGVKKMLMEILL